MHTFSFIAMATLFSLVFAENAEFSKDEALNWFLKVADSLGMSEKGALQLSQILKKLKPEGEMSLPTVEEMDQIIATVRPKVLQEAKSVLTEEDFSKVDAMMDRFHQAAIKYINSQG